MNRSSKPLLAALANQPYSVPVWFLRQAGRHLPEYRQLRLKHDFLELSQTPSLATEVTLQPVRRYNLDAAIIFADILTPCLALGLDIQFVNGHKPVVTPAITSPDQIAELRIKPAQTSLGFVGEALQMVKPQLPAHTTLIGFAGAPLTVATYLTEGGESNQFTTLKRMAYTTPEDFKALLRILVEVNLDYLTMQSDAGAEVLMLFDGWSSCLPTGDYLALAYPLHVELIQRLAKLGKPIIYYPGQNPDLLKYYSQVEEITALHIDWRLSSELAGSLIQRPNIVIQGNLDPQVFLGKPDFVKTKTHEVLTKAQSMGHTHIFNVGHGMLPHLPFEAVEQCVATVREFSL